MTFIWRQEPVVPLSLFPIGLIEWAEFDEEQLSNMIVLTESYIVGEAQFVICQ